MINIKFIILLALLSFQTAPKWKWIVHFQQLHGSTGMGIETMKSTNKFYPRTFTDSKKAWKFYWHQIQHRNRPDRLDIGGEPEIIRNVRIDSVQIK